MFEFIDEKEMISPVGMLQIDDKVLATISTAVIVFSSHIFDEVLDAYNGRKVGRLLGGAAGDVYAITAEGKNILVIRSTIGAPAAAAFVDEVIGAGIKNIVVFGICGALKDIPTRSFVVPDRALRDEGTSRHYVPSGEFITVKNAAFVADKLAAYGLSSAVGGVWTTDAFYRETRSYCDEARSKGCIAVDMECAALQAVCDYRGASFYTFFITADSFADDEWQPNYILDQKAAATPDKIGVAAAVRLAAEIS